MTSTKTNKRCRGEGEQDLDVIDEDVSIKRNKAEGGTAVSTLRTLEKMCVIRDPDSTLQQKEEASASLAPHPIFERKRLDATTLAAVMNDWVDDERAVVSFAMMDARTYGEVLSKYSTKGMHLASKVMHQNIKYRHLMPLFGVQVQRIDEVSMLLSAPDRADVVKSDDPTSTCFLSTSMERFSNMEEFVMSGHSCDSITLPQVAAALRQAPSLRSVVLSESKCSSAAHFKSFMSSMLKCTHLSELTIENSTVRTPLKAMGDFLRSKRTMSCLSLDRVQKITGKDALRFSRALRETGGIELKFFSLRKTELGLDAGHWIANALSFTPMLTSLDLSGSISARGGWTQLMRALHSLPLLESLDVSDGLADLAVNTALAEAVRHTPRLATLNLRSSIARQGGMDVVLGAFQHIPNLTSLSLAKNNITTMEALKLCLALPRLPHIRKIDLAFNPLHEVALAAIASVVRFLPNLEEVHIPDNAMGHGHADDLDEYFTHIPCLRFV
jgi:Ran GTPase-activating protein (RanGAP) involved in mRNA processing and transport